MCMTIYSFTWTFQFSFKNDSKTEEVQVRVMSQPFHGTWVYGMRQKKPVHVVLQLLFLSQ